MALKAHCTRSERLAHLFQILSVTFSAFPDNSVYHCQLPLSTQTLHFYIPYLLDFFSYLKCQVAMWYRVPFWAKEHILKLIVVMDAQLCEYTKVH